MIQFTNHTHQSRFINPLSHSVMTYKPVDILMRRLDRRCAPPLGVNGCAAHIETELADRLPVLLEYRAFAGEMAERLKARAC